MSKTTKLARPRDDWRNLIKKNTCDYVLFLR